MIPFGLCLDITEFLNGNNPIIHSSRRGRRGVGRSPGKYEHAYSFNDLLRLFISHEGKKPKQTKIQMV